MVAADGQLKDPSTKVEETDLAARRFEQSDSVTEHAIRVMATSVVSLHELDEMLAAMRLQPSEAPFHQVVRLSDVQRAELLYQVALRLPMADDVVPYRVLARVDLLKACQDLPEPYRQRLNVLKDGSMFKDPEDAVKAGVPVDVVVQQRGIVRDDVIERLNWVAEYVAAGHLYVGRTVDEAAKLQGITWPRPKAALQKYSVESAARAAVMSRSMSIEKAGETFGIDDAEELDRLHELSQWDSEFIDMVRTGGFLPDVYKAAKEEDWLGPMHAEMLAIMSPRTAQRLRAGATPGELANEIPIHDPLAWRLLNNWAERLAQPDPSASG